MDEIYECPICESELILIVHPATKSYTGTVIDPEGTIVDRGNLDPDDGSEDAHEVVCDAGHTLAEILSHLKVKEVK